MVRATLAGVIFIVASAAVPFAHAQAPACKTYNERNEPASSFRAGQKIIVRGTGFTARSPVFVRFEQDLGNADLGRPVSNDLGAFSLPATALPVDATDGDATIHALDARNEATCDISMTASEDGGSDLGGLYWVWGSALAVFGLLLVVLTYRRWQSERLSAAMDQLSFGGRRSERRSERVAAKAAVQAAERADPIADWELDPWEREVAGARAALPTSASSPPARSWRAAPVAELDDDVEWFDPEADEDSVKDPRVHGDRELEPESEPEQEPEPDPEPQRLPPGWEDGRLRPPARQGSDAIERLRREVKTWGRS